jgi:hypothetical protein
MGQVYSIFAAGVGIVTGSRAMPHFGQVPGRGWRTSGCIEHVYSDRRDGCGTGFGDPAVVACLSIEEEPIQAPSCY